MDVREPSGLESSERSSSMVAPNSYGCGAGISGHSLIMANSSGLMPSGMKHPFNIMPSPTPKLVDAPCSYYPDDGSRMRQEALFSINEPMKKKRGRPRKYGPDGTMALALCSTTSASECNNTNTSLSEPKTKVRGRPRGSGKKQQIDALGTPGTSFTPHVIIVKAGEDVASKIMSFSQQGPRSVFILSANGAIYNVTLRQPDTSGGTVTYEGCFEIISLSGSFFLTENDITRSRTGGLSVILAGPDGGVHGGGVAGMLMAATSVQVVLGSFLAKNKKPRPDPSPQQPLPAPFPEISSSPLSQSESEDDPSPVNRSSGHENSFGRHLQDLPFYSVGWSNSAK